MDSRRIDIEADIKEIDRLLSLSQRAYIKEILIGKRLRLSEELKSVPEEESHSSIVHDDTVWKPIDRFAWEQTTEEIKIFITNIGDLKTHPK